MFSFRTTPLEEQLDKALIDGNVGCFCTQNCWDTETGRYMYDIFKERGNLKVIFSPRDTELTPLTNHIVWDDAELQGLNAIVVEIQDVGTRYFNYTRDLFRLMETMKDMEDAPSLYIVDHINPAGRVVEGTITAFEGMTNVPKVAHRHGLTLGELANLYHNEIGAKYPLHVISSMAKDTNRQFLPWVIAPASDVPGLFTCEMYSGGGLWNNTNVTPGIGTARPYEYIGAPFIKTMSVETAGIPTADGVQLRPCSFTPACGMYAGQKCFGYQILLTPGVEYHSLMHVLRLVRYFRETYSEFVIEPEFKSKLADDVLYEYVMGNVDWAEAKDHIKVEEQKWIRKAKKYLLYDNQPYRMK